MPRSVSSYLAGLGTAVEAIGIESRKAKAGLLLFGVLFGKILLVARGDIDVALGMVNRLGPVSVVTGVALSLVPLGLALLAGGAMLVLTLDRLDPGALDSDLADAAMPLFIVSTVAALCISQSISVIASLVAGVTGACVWKATRKWLSVPIFVVALFVLLSNVGGSMVSVWLPTEYLRVRPGPSEEQVVGHVLDVSDGWAYVFTTDDRTLRQYKSDQIAARTVCRLANAVPSVAQLMWPAAVERCPGEAVRWQERILPTIRWLAVLAAIAVALFLASVVWIARDWTAG